MKKIAILSLLALMANACSKDDSSANGTVTLKASSTFSAAARNASAKGAVVATLTDFKVNIGRIKFEIDDKDDRYKTKDSIYEDVKMRGPFLLDLLNIDQTLSQAIGSLDIPNGQYEKIKFKFERSIQAGEMNGKTYLLKGTANGKPLEIWSDKELEVHMDFDDKNKDFVVNSNNVSLNIKLRLDNLIAKIIDLANRNLLLDGDGDGTIEVSTTNVDGNEEIGKEIRELIQKDARLLDRD
jgi:Domain of unknown function (DUF4382)